MKKLFIMVAFFAALFLISCDNKSNSGSGDAINLKFNLPKGAGYNYDIDMDMDMKGEANRQSVNMENKMAMGYHFGVTGDSAGWKQISSTITRIAMKINAGNMNMDFDTDKQPDSSDATANAMGKVLGAMKGAEFKFTMNEKGQVGSVTGINEMIQRMVTSTGADGGAVAAGMAGAFNEDNFKQNLQQSFAVYPGKPVKAGDSWTSTMDMNNTGMQMKMDNVYQLESVSGGNANVKVNSKISSPSGAQGALSGTMTGTMKYDVETGVPIDGDLKMDMNITAAPQSPPMTMEIKMKVKGKKD